MFLWKTAYLSVNLVILIFLQFSISGLLFRETHISMKPLALQKVC